MARTRQDPFLPSRDRDRGGINQEKLYRDIQQAQRARIASGMKLGREATEAAQAAGAIEAGRLAAARGMGGGMEETLRGAMSASQADALAASDARRRAKLLDDVQAVGVQMTEKAAASAAERAERKARRASEAGSVLGMLAGLGGLASAAAPLSAAAGPIGLALGGIGTIGSTIAGLEGQKARGQASDVRKEASEFMTEKLPQTTKGLEKITSMTPTYSGFESSFLGGQGMGRPRRTAQQASPFADALSDLSFIE